MLNYLEGAKHCQLNCDRLQTTARIILNDTNGTDSFALFLYNIAYEEMAKAIFCLFVHRKWVPEEFVNKVFRDHKTKVFLYEEIFKNFAVNDNVAYLGDKKLGEKSLEEFVEEHSTEIKKHRNTTTNFLYVGKNDKWKVPEVQITDIEKQEQRITHKINGLDVIFQFLMEEQDKNYKKSHNFKFFQIDKNKFTIVFNTKSN